MDVRREPGLAQNKARVPVDVLFRLSLASCEKTVYDWYANADANSDGSLTVQEIANATHKTVQEIEWWIRHQRADRNRDGVITPDEADRLSPDYYSQGHKPDEFDRMDSNEDGVLTLAEIVSATGKSEAEIREFLSRSTSWTRMATA